MLKTPVRCWVALALVCAWALAAVGPAWGQARVKTQWLTVCTACGQAATDSGTVSLGAAATIDTTRTFSTLMPQDAADSLSYFFVYFDFTNAPAIGESLYVAVDGSYDGTTWVNINSGNIGFQGFSSGSVSIGAVTTGRNGRVIFNGAANSTTNTTGLSPVRTPTQSYGGWWGYPILRLRIRSDVSADMVANSYNVRVLFPAASD